MDYFFHNSIKNYTIAVLDLFNDIHVPRYDEDGNRIKDITVPIKMGNRDKAFQLSEHDIENLLSGNVNILPRMALEFESMNKAQERDTNKLHKINKKSLNELSYEYHYNAVAYDFNYNVHIATRTFTDATIIVEQIAPMFRPDITIKIQELDIQSEPTSIPVSIGDFNFVLPDELAEDDIRIIEVSFPITVKGNLYLPIKDASIIKELQINTNIVEKLRTEKGIEYELEYKASKIKSSVGNYTKDEILLIDDSKITTIEHFKSSDPDASE
jgi:hypothetical protein